MKTCLVWFVHMHFQYKWLLICCAKKAHATEPELLFVVCALYRLHEQGIISWWDRKCMLGSFFFFLYRFQFLKTQDKNFSAVIVRKNCEIWKKKHHFKLENCLGEGTVFYLFQGIHVGTSASPPKDIVYKNFDAVNRRNCVFKTIIISGILTSNIVLF